MMFFVQHLQTYSPKNRAWKKVIDYVQKYEYVLIKDEVSLDALKHELCDVVNQINVEHPKLKRIQYSAGPIDGRRTTRIEAMVKSGGCPDLIFIMDICKVRSVYQYSEPVHSSNLIE